MDSLLVRLERRFGHLAPSNVISYLVGLQGIVYFLLRFRPELEEGFVLRPDALAAGEVWRLLTFFFLPWRSSSGTFGPIWTIFSLLFLHFVGRALEEQWGSFRFDLYILVGGGLTVLVCLLFGPVTNQDLFLTLMLAFAVEFPEYEINLYMVLPVKMKWLGLLDAGLLVFSFFGASAAGRASIVAALVTFFLFTGSTLLGALKGRARVSARGRVMTAYRQEAAPVKRTRVCAKCGASEKDDPKLEFRICDCQEKCGGRPTEYCLAHARNH
jgi:hypothetical protein